MKKSTKQQLRTTLIGLAAGGVFGFLIATFSKEAIKAAPKLSGLDLGILVACLIPAVLVLIAVHELGHVVFGLANGMEFLFMTVGPLRVYRENGRLGIGWNTNLNIMGGLAACIPSKSMTNISRGMTWMCAGGPIASMTALVPLYGLAQFLPAQFVFFGNVAAYLTFGIGALNLVPMRNGMFMTDGARVRLHLRGGPESDRMIAVTSLGVQSLSGVRPRDWSPELLAVIEGTEEVSTYTFGDFFLRSQVAFDRGDVAAAMALMEQIYEKIEELPSFQHPFIHLEMAFYAARYKGDVKGARVHLAEARKAPKGLLRKRSFLFVEAVILEAEAKVGEAAALAATALTLEGSPGAVVEAELLLEISRRHVGDDREPLPIAGHPGASLS